MGYIRKVQNMSSNNNSEAEDKPKSVSESKKVYSFNQLDVEWALEFRSRMLRRELTPEERLLRAI